MIVCPLSSVKIKNLSSISESVRESGYGYALRDQIVMEIQVLGICPRSSPFRSPTEYLLALVVLFLQARSTTSR